MSSPFSSPKHDGSPGRSHASVDTELSSPPGPERPAPLEWPLKSSLGLTESDQKLFSEIRDFEANLDGIQSTFEQISTSPAATLSRAATRSLNDYIKKTRQNLSAFKELVSELVSEQQSYVTQISGHTKSGVANTNTGEAFRPPGARGTPSLQEVSPTRDWESDSYRSHATTEQIEKTTSISNVQPLNIVRNFEGLVESLREAWKFYHDCGAEQQAKEAREALRLIQDCYSELQQPGAKLLSDEQIGEAVMRHDERRKMHSSSKRPLERIDVDTLETSAAKMQKQG